MGVSTGAKNRRPRTNKEKILASKIWQKSTHDKLDGALDCTRAYIQKCRMLVRCFQACKYKGSQVHSSALTSIYPQSGSQSLPEIALH